MNYIKKSSFRWRGGQLIQSRQAEEKLKEVLNFPGGWLIDEVSLFYTTTNLFYHNT